MSCDCGKPTNHCDPCSTEPRWLKPVNGVVMFPVRVFDRWYGYIDGKAVDITEEYEAWAKKEFSKCG